MVNIIDDTEQVNIAVNVAGWYLDWPYRKKITIDRNKVAADLVDFPVLISITDADLAGKARSDGFDVLFTDETGTFKLNHERESYVAPTGNLVAWVRVPTLLQTANTPLWMYYGKPTSADQQNQAGTWNNDFIMVQHMSQNGDIIDSTFNHIVGTSSIPGATLDVGKIGGSEYFGAIANNYNLGTHTQLQPGMDSWTISFWAKSTYTSGFITLLCYQWNADPALVVSYDVTNSGPNGLPFMRVHAAGANDINDRWKYWATPYLDGTWHYLTAVIDRAANRINLYQNGVLDNGISNVNDLAIPGVSPGVNAYINGVGPNGGVGNLDEFRIEKTNRPIGWIQTCFNNQNSPSTFYTLGTEET